MSARRKTLFPWFVVFLVLASTSLATAAPRKLASVQRDQAKIAATGTLRVVVRAKRPGRYTLVAGVRRTRGSKTMRAGRRTIRVAGRGRRVMKVRLRRSARRSLRACRSYRLTLTLRRNGRRIGRRVVRLRRGACRDTTTGSQQQIGPGTGTAHSPGSTAPGGARPPEDPGFDTSDFDRCDALDPAVCMQPFPSDHFTKAADTPTGRKLAFRDDAMPRNRNQKPISAADYNFSDGFSPGNKIITRVPGLDTPEAFRQSGLPPVDEPQRSLAADSRVVVINARTGARHLVWAEIDSNPKDPALRNLLIRPAKNFDEGERYVVALRGLRRADGSPIPAQRPFAVYRDGIITTDPKVEARRPDMEYVFGALRRAGVAREDLFLAWDFTVASAESTTGRMLSIRDRTFDELGDEDLGDGRVAGDAPVYTINPNVPDNLPDPPNPGFPIDPPSPSGFDGVRDFADGPIRRRIRGKIAVPCYLNTPTCATGSQFLLTGDGQTPPRTGETLYDFVCNIPRVATAASRARVGLYGHGLFGSQEEANSGQLRDFSNTHNFMFCAVDWNGMSFKDVPNVLTILQDLSRFPTLTDHVQQGFLGFLLLGRAMIHPEGFADDPAFEDAIDTSALYYDGNSQGGIYGGSLTAIAPDFTRAVLGVPGMNYSTLLRRSVDFDGYAEGDFEGIQSDAGLYDNYPNELERPLVLSIIQLLWDRADPNGYAHHMTDDPLPDTPRHRVLLHPAFGDHQVADVAAEVMARTVGARMHKPALTPGRARFRDRPYPDLLAPEPFFGLPPLGASYAGSGMVLWDTGPYTGTPGSETCEAGKRGTPPPPAGNVPPREGCDPHGKPRADTQAQEQKSTFLTPEGRIVDVCGGLPCLADE